MQLQLAHDEKIIKDWTYASYTEEKETAEHKIVVTNKRVVLSKKSENDISRTELLIDNVTGVTTEFAKNKSHPTKSAGIALIIIGTLLFIAGIVLAVLVNLYAGLVLLVLSIGLLIGGFVNLFRKKFSGKLSVTIHTNVPTAAMSHSIYTNNFSAPKIIKPAPITVVVNLAVAEEIVDTIGALIVAKDAQAQR